MELENIQDLKIDTTNLSLEDLEIIEKVETVLLGKLSEISAAKKEIERLKRLKEIEVAKEEVKLMQENKDFLLKILPKNHDRRSCNDVNPCNGYMDGFYPRCNRCLLLSILNGEDNGDYKINLSFDIKEL